MDEEELEQPSSKINVGSFFERVDSVDRVANRALSQSSSNLGIINNQKLIIQSLSVSIEAMETKIRDIANYIIVENKLEKDLKSISRFRGKSATTYADDNKFEWFAENFSLYELGKTELVDPKFIEFLNEKVL